MAIAILMHLTNWELWPRRMLSAVESALIYSEQEEMLLMRSVMRSGMFIHSPTIQIRFMALTVYCTQLVGTIFCIGLISAFIIG